MAAIHLIENEGIMAKVGVHEYESGNWHVAVRTAQQLVGGDLYLHPAQDAPSSYGGTILSFRVMAADEVAPGRIVFRFRFSPPYRGVQSRGGWGQEKKYVGVADPE